MPSTLLHLTFSQLVYPSLNVDWQDFMSGNLIPDETSDKKSSHYRIQMSNSHLFAPDLKAIKKDLLLKNDSLKLGMYCHLYLDYYFIKEFLISEFTWDLTSKLIKNPRTGKIYTYQEFTSKDGFYSAYNEINYKLLADKHFDMNIVNQIPILLPQTGLAIFDNRRIKTWREELDEHLAQKIYATDNFFDYDKLMNFIKKTAEKFIEEVNVTQIQ